LRHDPKVLRAAQRLALSAAVSVLAAGLAVSTTKPALAEFQIQEADIEKGAVQLSYRGAVHWGLPAAEEPPLVQSHEFEAQYGLTNWWLFSFTLGTNQPKARISA
jgi:hypothetical protein